MDTVSYIDSIIKVNQESRNWLVRSASFLYENYNDKPEWHSELYATVFKDSIKYLNVLDSLFIIDPKLIDKKNVIRMNLDSFLIFERRYAKERYNKFGGIDNPDFSFLISICDSSILTIAVQELSDTTLQESSRLELLDYIHECYPDWADSIKIR